MEPERWRVTLPPDVTGSITVFVNGVRQEPGRDYERVGGSLLFSRPLIKEGRLGFWKWFGGAFGIGTYGQNDVVDVAWGGGLAHALDIEPPTSGP